MIMILRFSFKTLITQMIFETEITQIKFVRKAQLC